MKKLLSVWLGILLVGCGKNESRPVKDDSRDQSSQAQTLAQGDGPASEAPEKDSRSVATVSHPTSTVPELIKELNDANLEVRWMAAWALGGIGSAAEEAVPTLRDAVNDAHIAWAAVEALKRIGPALPPSFRSLIQKLRDKDVSTRLSAAQSLSEMRSQSGEAVAALIQALRDENREVRLKAVWALGEMGETAKDAVPALEEASEKDPKLSTAAMQATVKIAASLRPPSRLQPPQLTSPQDRLTKESETSSELMRVGVLISEIVHLKDPDVSVRFRALRTFSQFAAEDKAEVPVDLIIEALKDNDSSVRWMAAQVLGNIKPETNTAIPALIEALKDDDQFVRSTAATALAELGPRAKEAITTLVEKLEDKNKYVQVAAAGAILKLDRQATDALSILIKALKDKDILVRCAALNALGRTGPEAKPAAPAIIEAAKEDSKHLILRAAAADALANIDIAALSPAGLR